jgi:large subunit ribosomal protein L25
MSQKTTFTAQPRSILGKKTKQLRRQGLVPANLMGRGVNSVPMSVGLTAFNRLYDEVGDTGLIYLTIEGETQARPVLVDQVDPNPLTGEAQHVVFKQVNLKEKITAEIPVELVGEFGVKEAALITVHPTIEVEALPTDFPENFTIDISLFTEVGQAVTFNQLDFDRSKITLMVNEEELDTPIVSVQPQQAEIVEEVEAVEEAPVDGVTPEEEAAPTDDAASEAKSE